MRITEIAPTPAGVAKATIVSSFTLLNAQF